MKPEIFLAKNAVFSREEFGSALRGRGLAGSTLDSHLTRWRRQGRIARVKPGVFLRLDVAGQSQDTSPDYLALASRMAPDAVLGYHTALEVHGMAQSVFERFTFLTWTKARPTSFLGRRFVPVRPRASLRPLDAGSAWVERAERRSVGMRVTNIERTLADVLDRPDISGGFDEVWRLLAGYRQSTRMHSSATCRSSGAGRWQRRSATSSRCGVRNSPFPMACSTDCGHASRGRRSSWTDAGRGDSWPDGL